MVNRGNLPLNTEDYLFLNQICCSVTMHYGRQKETIGPKTYFICIHGVDCPEFVLFVHRTPKLRCLNLLSIKEKMGEGYKKLVLMYEYNEYRSRLLVHFLNAETGALFTIFSSEQQVNPLYPIIIWD